MAQRGGMRPYSGFGPVAREVASQISQAMAYDGVRGDTIIARRRFGPWSYSRLGRDVEYLCPVRHAPSGMHPETGGMPAP